MVEIYNEILYKPLFNALIAVYNILPVADMGLAIIVLTVLIRFLLYPLSKKAVISQLALKEIQPQVAEIQKQHKDRQMQAKALMELYQKHGINPFSGCLPILIQIPILIALYQVFLKGFDLTNFVDLYSFVSRPEVINSLFLGIIDLPRSNFWLSLLAGITQFFQTKMIIPAKPAQDSSAPGFAQALNQQMLYFMPVITVLIAMTLPSALALFWSVTNIFSLGQQIVLAKFVKPIK